MKRYAIVEKRTKRAEHGRRSTAAEGASKAMQGLRIGTSRQHPMISRKCFGCQKTRLFGAVIISGCHQPDVSTFGKN